MEHIRKSPKMIIDEKKSKGGQNVSHYLLYYDTEK